MPGPTFTDKVKDIWDKTDRRWLTTPAGAAAGMALVRTLVPKRHRNWKSYAGGAAGGGAAGFGVGTILEQQRAAAAKEPSESPRAAAFRKAYQLLMDPDAQATPQEYRKALSKMYEYDITGKQRSGLEFFFKEPVASELRAARLSAGEEEAPGISVVGPGRYAAAGTAGLLAGKGTYAGMKESLANKMKTYDNILTSRDLTTAASKLEALEGADPIMAAAARRMNLSPRAVNRLVAAKKSVLIRSAASAITGLSTAGLTFGAASIPRQMTPEEKVQDLFSHYLAWRNRLSALQGLLERKGATMGGEETAELKDAIEFTKNRMQSAHKSTRSAKMRR